MLLAGSYNSDDLFNPELLDATTYKISINGFDRANNKGLESSISKIKVDLTPPEFSNLLPESGSFINLASIGWSLSENIDSGTVYFKRNTSDARLEAVLDGEELNAGIKQPAPLSNYVALRDGEVYTISIIGKDFASNVSKEISVSNITYDTSPPKISIISPEQGSFVNSNEISYTVNEPLTEAEMIWEGDGQESLSFKLRNDDILEGKHILKDYGVNPKEKVFYTIFIKGIDRALSLIHI